MTTPIQTSNSNKVKRDIAIRIFQQAVLLAFVGLLAASSSSAMAQSESSLPTKEEETVVLNPFVVSAGDSEGYRAKSSVSGLLYKVPISKLPLPVNVVTEDFILDTGSLTVEDSLRYVSGVVNGERNESGTERFVVRGFRTNTVMRDGVEFNIPTDTVVVDRVEVLKGPASIAFGSLDPAGVINIVTKRPSYKKAANVSAVYGEYGLLRTSLDITQPLARIGKLTSAGRLVASYMDQGQPRPNEYRERVVFAPSLRLDYGARTQLDFAYTKVSENGRINRLATPFNNIGQVGTQAVGFVPVNRDFTWVTPNDSWDSKSESVDARLVQRFTDDLAMQITWTRSTGNNDQYFLLGPGAIKANSSGAFIATNVLPVTQVDVREIELFAASMVYNKNFWGMKHTLSAGYRVDQRRIFSYGYRDSRQPAQTILIADASGPAPLNFTAPQRTLTDPFSPFAVAILGDVRTIPQEVAKNWSAYANDYIALYNDRLNVLLGAQRVYISGQNQYATTPQVGFVYEVGPGWNLYALYSETFRPNSRSNSLDPTSPFLPPERGVGKEVGLKFDLFKHRLTGSVSVFDITRDNIVQILAGVFGVNNRIPSGQEVSRGAELDLVYSPVKNLSLTFAYAYTDAYISKQLIESNNPDLNTDGVSDAVGMKKEGVARHDVRVWARYDLPKNTALSGMGIGGGFTWREGPIPQFGTFLQRLIREEGDPIRLDLFASYKTKIFKRPTSFRLNWQNATDELYRDKRGFFVTPSMLTLSASTRF